MSERIKGVMAQVFGISVSGIPDDVAVGKIAEWDSLRHLELMLALEMEFQVRISTNAMLELLSLEAIEGYLRERMEARRA